MTTLEGGLAVTNCTEAQRAAYKRERARNSVRGVILLSDGTLQVGYETLMGRDREVTFAADGSVIERRNTWTYS